MLVEGSPCAALHLCYDWGDISRHADRCSKDCHDVLGTVWDNLDSSDDEAVWVVFLIGNDLSLLSIDFEAHSEEAFLEVCKHLLDVFGGFPPDVCVVHEGGARVRWRQESLVTAYGRGLSPIHSG